MTSIITNYLTTAWRYNIKNALFSTINIAGLAIGLMSCILIMLFVREESGYDQWVPNADRVVRMHSAYLVPGRPPFLTVRSAGMMMPAVRDYATAEVEDGTRLVRYGVTVRQNGEGIEDQVMLVDGSFFNVFDLPFINGSVASSFNKPFDLVLTEETAMRYFGTTDVIGKPMEMCCVRGQAVTLAVTGVIKDIPENSHMDLSMLVYMHNDMFGPNNGILDTWTSVNVYTYFKLNEGVTPDEFQQRLSYWVNNESPFVNMYKNLVSDDSSVTKVDDVMKHKIMPLTDLHLHARKDAGNMGDLTPMGDANMIKTFVIVAGLVLLIACINFMNLATAKATKRAKEVSLRKVLGASRLQVASQFMLEAIALVFVALLFAVVAVEIILPSYNSILGTQLTMELFNDLPLLGALIAIALVVGIGAGLYPAVFLSNFQPAHVLKANKSSEAGGSASLRNLLVVFQFATSIILVISTLVVYAQTHYSNQIDVGYESDNKLVLNIRTAGGNLESLRQELVSHPNIRSVVYSSEAPTMDNENNNNFTLVENLGDGSANTSQLLNYHNMDYGFFEAYGVEPLAGRLFSREFGSDTMVMTEEGSDSVPTAAAILNESALAKLGLSSPAQAIGKTLRTNHDGARMLTIVGVIPDIHFRSIKFEIRPTVYMLNPQRFRVATITFDGSNYAAMQNEIEDIWKKHVPMQPISQEFLSAMMAAQYADDVAQAQLFLVFSALAIFVACLGLYGLAAYTAERRTKEIGIRKVMGASVKDIVQLLVWQFSKPVLVANLLAWPVAFWFTNQWLQSFQYRIGDELVLLIMVLSSVIALLVAWLTVAARAFAVANANPIKALRYE